MTPGTRHPSLRGRLLLNLLVPGAVLVVLLSAGGSVLIHNIVRDTHDRLLDGSLLAISERLGVDGDEVTVDLPPAALGMLESQAQDSIYYSVRYGDEFVTGYPDLPQPSPQIKPGKRVRWTAAYNGSAVRLVAESRRLYGLSAPTIVVIGETMRARETLERQMLVGLALLETGLVSLLGLLGWHAVHRGLRPLAEVSSQIDRRLVRDAVSWKPLDLQSVPQEALSPAVAMNALLKRLGQSVGAIQRFTADASHQMLTPLAVILTHLATVERQGSDSSAGRSALSSIERAVQRLQRMSRQLVALARAEEDSAGAMDTGLSDIGHIVEEIVAERYLRTEEVGVALYVEKPDKPMQVVGDEALMSELVANLVDNAVRYNRKGGYVTVRVISDGETTILEVEDNGPGLQADEWDRVFERFYRAPASSAQAGSGLGLAIVRAVCDRAGAKVQLSEGQTGAGLCATVTLLAAGTSVSAPSGSP
jgi:two-component system, OmpR family, sensor histidine kinase TctE